MADVDWRQEAGEWEGVERLVTRVASELRQVLGALDARDRGDRGSIKHETDRLRGLAQELNDLSERLRNHQYRCEDAGYEQIETRRRDRHLQSDAAHRPPIKP